MATDAADLPDAAATCITGSDLLEPVGQLVGLVLDGLPLVPQKANHVAHHRRQGVVCVLENICHGSLQLGRLLTKDHATLQKKRAYLVDGRSAPRDQPVTDPMHRLQIKLIVGLDRDKAHVLTVDRLGNGFGVNEVVLVRLTNGFTNCAGISLTS
jgi:hypothetical protein